MSNWTPEAREFLDGYLAQVRALVRQAGEDADETATELRDHIEREAADAAGDLVTLDHVRAVLASVGTPEQVASADSFLARASGVTPPKALPPQGIPSYPAPRKRIGAVGCVVIAIAVPLVLLLAILGAMFAFRAASFQKASINAHQLSTVAILNEVYEAEKQSLQRGAADVDGDGIPDFAEWAELKVGDMPPGTSIQLRGNYRFQLQTKPSASNGGKPAFLCEATPMIDEFPNAYAIDETGTLRTIPVHDRAPLYEGDQGRRERAGIEITNQLRALADSERRILEYDRKDKDGDGIPDYASLLELRTTLSDIDTEDYVLNVVTRDSASNGGKPGFTCTATPRPTLQNAPTYAIDETGNLTITSSFSSMNPKVKAPDPIAIQVPLIEKTEREPQPQVVDPQVADPQAVDPQVVAPPVVDPPHATPKN